ncbi:hypothetical protein SpCBS45565_g00399 [Spizellomyces sp. 'palustris']|nr:hypothetical protein SpCBS45565_g00399 [Spizellomyces sp. 'palustris']
MSKYQGYQLCAVLGETLSLEATISVLDYTLPRILSGYPRLERLIIEPSRYIDTIDAAYLLTKVAQQFRGHPTLRYLFCSSDWIVPGAVEGCPRLEVLIVPSLRGKEEEEEEEEPQAVSGMEEDGRGSSMDTMDVEYPDDLHENERRIGGRHWEIWRGSGMRRNLTWIMKHKPTLTHIEMNKPTFWNRIPKVAPISPLPILKHLKLSDICSWALVNFLDFLRQSGQREQPALRHLITLSLDLDWLIVPTNAYEAISLGCPNLQSLTFIYANLTPAGVEAIATHLPRLKCLVMDKCDMWFYHGWMSLVRYLCSRMKELEKVGLEKCSFRELPLTMQVRFPVYSTRAGTMGWWTHSLRSLKLYANDEYRPSTADLEEVVERFPQLQELKLEVPAETFTKDGIAVWGPAAVNLHGLKKLVLRSGKYESYGTEPVASNTPLHLPNLQTVSIWSCPIFPFNFILPNASNLTTLKLNFLPTILPDTTFISLPNLRYLAVRGITVLAHPICLSIVNALTADSPKLEVLIMEALHRDCANLPSAFFPRLVEKCPKLRVIRLDRFITPRSTLTLLANATIWPNLASFHVWGQSAIHGATIEWEQTSLCPFLQTHRLLRSFHVGLHTLEVPGFELEGRCTDEHGYCHARNVVTYASYARSIKSRWWWLEDVVVHGPIKRQSVADSLL